MRGNATAHDELIATAQSGNIDAMFLLGRLHDVSRTPNPATLDLAAARAWYEKAAQIGHAPAQFALGNMFNDGEGAPFDRTMARHWFRLAAHGGFAEAQMHYARMFQTGRGGDQSNEEAAFWYQQAAHRGHDLAATNLGLMHFQKQIAGASDGVAFTLFGIAADKLDGLAHVMELDHGQQHWDHEDRQADPEDPAIGPRRAV